MYKYIKQITSLFAVVAVLFAFAGEAVAAIQHAEDDPSPTPMGMSESIVISNPLIS